MLTCLRADIVQGQMGDRSSGRQLDTSFQLPSRQVDGAYVHSDAGSEVDQDRIENTPNPGPMTEALSEAPTAHASDLSPELHAIALNIQRVLKIRQRFIHVSLQGAGDNPKDRDDWRIYPPPPNPKWDANNNLIDGIAQPKTAGKVQPAYTSPQKGRKPGQNVGEDFDIEELEPWPALDEIVDFELDCMSIYQLYDTTKSQSKTPLVQVPDLRTYYKAMEEIQGVSSDGPTKSFAYRQLDILEGKFQLHYLINSYEETADCKKVPHRDFYNVRKVDTHVHHSACMNQKHLLRFIKSKIKKCPNEVVMFRDGRELTLQEVFDSIQLSAYDLSIDTLDMHVS